MNVLIAEDESLAAERLQELLVACEPTASIVERVDTVEDLVYFFQSGKKTDLLLLDIQLADGKSFELFDRVEINVPVIFVTAFDQYALQAFRFFSIDYILKPVQKEDLGKALQKFRRISSDAGLLSEERATLKALAAAALGKAKKRILIKSGNKLVYKNTEDAGYFFAEGKAVYLVSVPENRKYLVDYTMEELENILDPKTFFRISRKFMVNISCIQEIKTLTGSRYDLRLRTPHDHSLQVSRERAQEFRNWLDQ